MARKPPPVFRVAQACSLGISSKEELRAELDLAWVQLALDAPESRRVQQSSDDRVIRVVQDVECLGPELKLQLSARKLLCQYEVQIYHPRSDHSVLSDVAEC